MRIFKLIAILVTILLLAVLIAINIALASRKSSGPDLGAPAYESELEAGPVRDARLWYMSNLLGRWDETGRCESPETQWVFARRRIIENGISCEIRRFLPGQPVEIELYRCAPDGQHMQTVSTAPARTLKFEPLPTGDLIVEGEGETELKRCTIPV